MSAEWDDEDAVLKLKDGEPVPDHEPGPVEQQTRSYIESLGDLDDVRAPLAEASYVLSRALDRGQKGMALSATSRELRETLSAIVENADGGDAGAAIMAQLARPDVPAAVGDSKESG